MSNSSLVSVTKISPNKNSPRAYPIRKITIHHMACNLTVEQCLDGFANPARYASANYVIGSDGRIGLCVDEADRAWTSSSPQNDNQAITIEVANDEGDPTWHVSDKAMKSLVDLCVDICERNGIEKLVYTGDTRGNVTLHRFFAATLCPGPYIESKLSSIISDVNSRLGDKIGDVNGDGKVNAKDVTALMKGIVNGTAADNPAADVNGDGKVNAKDVTDLMKKIVSDPKFKEGDEIRIRQGATYTDGTPIPQFVIDSVLYVRAVESGGDVLLVSTIKYAPVYTGRIFAADAVRV